MSVYLPPKVNTQFITYVGLVSQASTLALKSNPTIAAGDFKVSTDGGALGNLGTLPTVTPASSVMVKYTLSTSEMNGANATVVAIDAAGAEWCDRLDNFQTVTRQLEDLAFPLTSGRGILVDANGVVDARLADAVSHGGTLGSSTATLALSRASIVSQSSNTVALTVTGNGTGSGMVATSGAGATGDGIQATSGATNGNGFVVTGVGTGNGLKVVSASGDAISAVASTSGHGITATGAGTTKHGINASGGATTSHGINATGGGVGHGILATSGGGATGDGIKAVSAATNGNGFNLVGNGTGDGLLTTGGASAGGDGIQATAGGGVDIRGNQTGNITGTLSGSVGSISANGIAAGVLTSGAIVRASFAADTGLQPIRSNTATAGAATTITLDASASAVDSFYNNTLILLTGGTGVGQARFISAYVGATKVATVATWVTNPDNTSTFAILPFDAVAGASAPTTAQIATAVWQDLLAGADFGTAASIGKLLKDDIDAAVSSRMATYTQPTGFLAATFPAGTVANTTNITAGTITTVGTLTTYTGNTPQTGDAFARLGAPVGASISADIAALPTDADVQTAAAAAIAAAEPIEANIKQVNDVPLQGDGSVTPWGPA